jgi:uncharacterized membrane protein YfcA
MQKKHYVISSLGVAFISLALSVYMGARAVYHDPAFYVASATGIVLLILLLFRMTKVEIKDEEIQNQDWTAPLAYALGLLILIAFYTVEWYFLGCFGPPNPPTGQLLLLEIANRPGIQDAIYFSVITSTTLGYGDLAPLTGGAKIFAATQALTCSIYTVTGLAILLGKRR